MKQRNYKGIIVLMLSLLLIFSCNKEDYISTNSPDPDILAAKTWFESEINSPTNFKYSPQKGVNIKIKPDWSSASKHELNMLRTVEVPLLTMGCFGFSTKESKNVYDITGDKRYLQSLTRLVILKENKNANLIGFLMTIIPDLEYRTSKLFDAFKSSYKNWQEGFSGYIFYHNLDGRFSKGWKFENGKVIKVVIPKESSNLPTQFTTKSPQVLLYCETFEITHYWMSCTDWYSDAAHEHYVSTTCTVYTTEDEPYTECQVLNDDGSEGGGGYPTPQQNPQPYVPQTGDKLAKPNISLNGVSQFPNCCVPATMAYINQQFCGGNKDQLSYVTSFQDNYNINLWSQTGGVSSQKIFSFVNMHFNTVVFNGYQFSINNGWIVMTDMATEVDTISHAVAIVGYHSNGDLIYMDPSDGTMKEGPASLFSYSFRIPIVGCKFNVE